MARASGDLLRRLAGLAGCSLLQVGLPSLSRSSRLYDMLGDRQDAEGTATPRGLQLHGVGEGKTAAAQRAAEWLRGPKRVLIAPITVGSIEQMLDAVRLHDHLLDLAHDLAAPHDVVLVEGSNSLCVQVRFSGSAVAEPDVVPQMEPSDSELAGRSAASDGELAEQRLFSAVAPASFLRQRLGRLNRYATRRQRDRLRRIDRTAGRLAGLSRQDIRHWRRILRYFVVRVLARIGRAASTLPPAPHDLGDLLPLRGALTPTAPPAAAA